VPKVDGFITDYLKGGFPQKDDMDLSKVQSMMLKAILCMWVELIDNSLLSDSEATINVQDVLNVIGTVGQP